jgi:hypothetical protein
LAGDPSSLGPRGFDELPRLLEERGFEIIQCERCRFDFLNLSPLDEWAPVHHQTVMCFTARKRTEVGVKPRREAFARYFRGDAQALLNRTLAWGPAGVSVRTVAVSGGRPAGGRAIEPELRFGGPSVNIAEAAVDAMASFVRAVDARKTLREALKAMNVGSESEGVLFVQALEASGAVVLGGPPL